MKLFKILLILSVLSASFSIHAEKNTDVNIKKMNEKILWEDAKTESDIWKRSYKRKKAAGISLIAIGATTTGVGLGFMVFFFANFGSGGYFPYPIMTGGLSIISGGVGLFYSGDYSLNKSNIYNVLSANKPLSAGISAEEYFEKNQLEKKVKIMSSKSLFNHGKSLALLSIPMFFIPLIAFADGYRDYKENKKSLEEENSDENDQCLGCFLGSSLSIVAYELQALYFVPAVTVLTSGIVMMVVAKKREKSSINQSSVTLNNLSPMIDPIRKTYGISMGFSF